MAAPKYSFYARAVALRGLLCCRWRLLLLICAIGAAAGFTTARSGDANGLQSRLLTVQPSRFRITRECSGLIEPVTTSVVQSGCHWTVSILSLVPEGTEVQAGDVVCVLDSSEIQEFLRSREISLIRANAAVTASLKSEELQRTAAERRLSDAQF
ncbi:MAG: hypothetical protein ACK48Y_07845, partial [Planctomyces sp.]